VDYSQPFFTSASIEKARAAARPQRRMTALNRQLDILRVVVNASNENKVLQAAGDK